MDDITPESPTPEDFSNAEKFLSRMYNSTKDTLDEFRVTTLLACDKPEDNPPASNAAHYHLCRSFCQASKWLHACKLCHANLPSPISSGGFKETNGQLVPIMVTTNPMPKMLVELIICDCQTGCGTKKCACKRGCIKCCLLCHKKLKYNHDTCQNQNVE